MHFNTIFQRTEYEYVLGQAVCRRKIARTYGATRCCILIGRFLHCEANSQTNYDDPVGLMTLLIYLRCYRVMADGAGGGGGSMSPFGLTFLNDPGQASPHANIMQEQMKVSRGVMCLHSYPQACALPWWRAGASGR